MTDAILSRLMELKDEKYADFQRKLTPTVRPERIIGVRTPALRALAREISGTALAEEFLDALPHEYYDENNLHAVLIERIKGFDEAAARVEAFLPYVDNWATCDIMTPRALKKDLPALMGRIRRWTASGETYTIRFGIEMLLAFFLDGEFSPEQHGIVTAVKSEEYYVNMMRAWYFATALAKQREATLPILEARALDPWTHNKTIQKAVESYRITDADKAYLKTLKIK